jgi:hypothetical protein
MPGRRPNSPHLITASIGAAGDALGPRRFGRSIEGGTGGVVHRESFPSRSGRVRLFLALPSGADIPARDWHEHPCSPNRPSPPAGARAHRRPGRRPGHGRRRAGILQPQSLQCELQRAVRLAPFVSSPPCRTRPSISPAIEHVHESRQTRTRVASAHGRTASGRRRCVGRSGRGGMWLGIEGTPSLSREAVADPGQPPSHRDSDHAGCPGRAALGPEGPGGGSGAVHRGQEGAGVGRAGRQPGPGPSPRSQGPGVDRG